MVELALLDDDAGLWRRARADRVALLVDSAAYFAAALEAIGRARHSITLLGWGFDPRTRMKPDRDGGEHGPDEIGNLLIRLSEARPELNIRLLIWKSALPISASQHFFPHRAKSWFAGTRVQFELDAEVPNGACHHQKVLVIDDAVAFSGGGDISVDRWDSTAHLDVDPRRIMPGGIEHVPRHEVMMMVDGEAAQALGDLARARWTRATGETLVACPTAEDHDPWPPFVTPMLTGARVGIARTQPGWRGEPEVREIETLHLQAIARAERSIYLENQYFTAPLVVEALKARLAEPDGPEVVLVSTEHAPSWFDQATMDRTRWTMVETLKANDPHGRFVAYCPQTSKGRFIIVHSKVSIIDDELLRVGSGNLNNRSFGFDTECDLIVETREPAARAAIAGFRAFLLAHHIGCAPAAVEAAIAAHGGRLVPAVEAVRQGHVRMKPIPPVSMGPLARFISAFHIGDPVSTHDSWRPMLRRRVLRRRVEALRPGLKPPPLPASGLQSELGEEREVV
jgi:phosphatidylserine/phosphatidylglycerophosphate/cardiolipin synthase-like enzyme